MPPVAGDIIGRIEYQTVFLMVIKKEQEFYFKTQIDAIKEKKELPHSDILSNVAPFIDDKTGLLKTRGRIGYDMKPHRYEEFLQQHTEHYKYYLAIPRKYCKGLLIRCPSEFQLCIRTVRQYSEARKVSYDLTGQSCKISHS